MGTSMQQSIFKPKSHTYKVNNHGKGHSQRATDASVRLERNPAFCKGRGEMCKQSRLKKFA